MCQSMQTKKGQEWIPDFLKDTTGHTATVPPRGVDVPLEDAADAKRLEIKRRRERMKQAEENSGSHKPTGIRTRKDIMEELT